MTFSYKTPWKFETLSSLDATRERLNFSSYPHDQVVIECLDEVTVDGGETFEVVHGRCLFVKADAFNAMCKQRVKELL